MLEMVAPEAVNVPDDCHSYSSCPCCNSRHVLAATAWLRLCLTLRSAGSRVEFVTGLPCRIMPGHEYTQSNARFAIGLEPSNVVLQRRCREVDHLRSQASSLSGRFQTIQSRYLGFQRGRDLRQRRQTASASHTAVCCQHPCSAHHLLINTFKMILCLCINSRSNGCKF